MSGISRNRGGPRVALGWPKCPSAHCIKLKGFFWKCLSAFNSTSNKCRILTMEAIQQQQVVVCPVAKAVVKRKSKPKTKTREQRLAEEPSCPVCLEELTEETLCNPMKCHNICVVCRPVCNKCPLCRKAWPSTSTRRRRACETSGFCENMTLRKCSGTIDIDTECEKYVCRKCRNCESCKDALKEQVGRFMMRFTNNPLID